MEQHLQDGRWVLISDQPTADGGIVSVRTDITELKQREDELRQAQKMEALGPGCVKTLAAMPIRDGLTV
ncbi:MAG: PAS-domain containing protein [Alphaproteobacteria bacterium]